MDWQSFVFDSEGDWINRLTRAAHKQFHWDPNLADEAFNYALEKLSADGWRRLQDFKGESGPGTFLLAVFGRLLIDFSRERFGRLDRPPAWITTLGEPWPRIYRLLCLDREEPESIVVSLTTDAFRPDAIRDAMKMIKARVRGCGQGWGPIAMSELPEPAAGHLVEPPAPPERALANDELTYLILVLAALLHEPVREPPPTEDETRRAAGLVDGVMRRRPELEEAFGIDDEALLMLRLFYERSRSAAAIGRDLGLPEHQVRRRLERARRRLREGLRRMGLAADDLSGLLDE